MDLMTTGPDLDAGLGPWLLRRAREHGMTGDDLADLLAMPVHRIRRITTSAELDNLPAGTLRALAARLDLPWPQWLQPTSSARAQPRPDPHTEPAAISDSSDAARLHAVLASVLGRPLRLDQVAHVLGWAPARVQRAAARLGHGDRGLRLTVHDNQTLQLTINPGTLDRAARERLRQVTHQHQGPAPGVALIAYRLGHPGGHKEALDLTRAAPDLLADAASAGYLTYRTDAEGRPTDIRLAPDVAFSLGIDPPNPKGTDTLMANPLTLS
jgi:transcriptional regulator with XRE-family HTH domain